MVYQRGTKVNARYAVLFYHETGDPGHGPRFGVVASKRLGGAVRRNRAKRLLREAVRGASNRLIRADLWIVLVAKQGILECSAEDVSRDLMRAMVDEGLVRGQASA